MTVPQAQVLGLDDARPASCATTKSRVTGDFGEIDWTEFYAVVKGNGPCNRQRSQHRRSAHEEGAWVRDAAAAYAAKQAQRRPTEAAA